MTALSVNPLTSETLTQLANSIFTDLYTFEFSIEPNQQISFDYTSIETKRLIHLKISTKDSLSFIETLTAPQCNTLEKQRKTLMSLLENSNATKNINWQTGGRIAKSSSPETPEKIQQLNELAHEVYGASQIITFAAGHRNQLSFTIQRKDKNQNSRHVVNIQLSQQLLATLGNCDSFEEKANALVKFFKTNSNLKHLNWEPTPLHPITIPGTLIEFAKEELRKREERINKVHYLKIQKIMNQSKINREFLEETWSKALKKKIKGAPDLKNLTPSEKIEELKQFSSLILKSNTYQVVLREELSRNQLIFEANDELIRTLLKIEDLLTQFIPYIAFIEKNLNHLAAKRKSYNFQLEQLPNYEQFKTLYPCQSELKSLTTPAIHYNKLEITFPAHPPYNFESLNLKESKDLINQLLKEQYDVVVAQFKNTGEEARSLQCDPLTYFTLRAIQDNPQKGITTYVDILKGSTAAKMKEYHYDQLEAYGQLCTLKSPAIKSHIEKTIRQKLIEVRTYKASFGRYDGLSLSELGRKTLLATSKPSKKESLTSPQHITVKSFTSFLALLRSGIEAHLLISQFCQLKTIQEDEILPLIQFIANERSLYRSQEMLFIEHVAKIYPPDFKPLLELNIHLNNGVIKTTFKTLYKLI